MRVVSRSGPDAGVLGARRRALAAGCDGVVSSGLEAPLIRRELGSRILVVTPGIRPVENKPADDQKRTVDVAQAFANGADYIVIGRPIRQASDPRAAAFFAFLKSRTFCSDSASTTSATDRWPSSA